MGETREHIGIYGEIDRAVAADVDRRAAVSRLLPVYRNPDVRWFDDFVEWTREMDREPDFPELNQALEGLARLASPPPRMRARRLFAIAVATRAFPALLDPEGDAHQRAADALAVEGLAQDDDDAKRLLQLLGSDDELPPVDEQTPESLNRWWQSMVEGASSQGLITSTVEEIGHRPCTGRLVMVELPGGGIGPVATLEAGFDTDKVSFDEATSFLDPKHWPRCNGFWCEMAPYEDQPPGVHRYHEVVSTNCDNRDFAWTIEAELDFSFRSSPGFASADYQLSDGRPHAGDDVLVDEGSLTVTEIGTAQAPRVMVTTTKRVKFSKSFSGEALALMMCALGYASVVEDLVFSCAAVQGHSGEDFPGEPPVTSTPAGDTAGSDDEDVPVTDVLIDEAAAAVKACVDDYAKTAKATFAKIAQGQYTADAAVQDTASMCARMVRDTARVADLGVRMAARMRGREPAGG